MELLQIVVVNEGNLDMYTLSIRTAIEEHRRQISELEDMSRIYKKITQVNKSNPIDPDTRQVMLQNRRDQLYDQCEPYVRQLLGWTQADLPSEEE